MTREEIYRTLEARIGNTPLVKYKGDVPNGNAIFIKRECDNPFGSHYDRVYLALFRHYETIGQIKPNDSVQGKVLETTSGTAGVSFAGIGRLLGYECHVAIPNGVDAAVLEEIRQQGATIYFTPEKDYIAGFPAFLREFLHRHRGEFTFLNHSMKTDKRLGHARLGHAYTNNEITLAALQGIGKEISQHSAIGYFIPAVGNGSSILGPNRALPELTQTVVFESFQSAVAYDTLYPDKYEQEFGIKPGTLPKHKLRGTSYQGIDFPHIRTAINEKIIDDVILVSDRFVDADYATQTGRSDTQSMPHWDAPFAGYEELGRTTQAGIAVALRLAEQVRGKNLVIIAYDKAERYDPL